MKDFLAIMASCLLLLSASFAQEEYIQTGRDGIYQIFVGKAAFGTEQEVFSNLAHLGFLRPFSIAEPGDGQLEGDLPVFLGPYIGRATADYILRKVKDAGYVMAYIEGDEVSLTEGDGAGLTYTVQIGAFEKFDANYYDSHLNEPAHGLHLIYEEGLIKVLAGLYPASFEDYLEARALPFWNRSIEIDDAFVRPFRLPYRE